MMIHTTQQGSSFSLLFIFIFMGVPDRYFSVRDFSFYPTTQYLLEIKNFNLMNISKILLKTKIVADFFLSISFFYVAFCLLFSNILINLFSFIIAIFFFMQALGNVDKLNGYGTNNTTKKP